MPTVIASWEIGTGTGYATALGCHRLGADHVTSVEVDPAVADRARKALEDVGYRPHLVVGDGLTGFPDDGPYDAVIATCSVRQIPSSWIRQCRPGAVIVTPVIGSLLAGGLAKVKVTEPSEGLAQGGFVDVVSFMPARSQIEEPVLPDLSAIPDNERPAVVGPEVLSDEPSLGMMLQVAVQFVQHIEITDPGFPPHLLVAPDGAWAALSPNRDTGAWIVRQNGPRRLWDLIEAVVQQWYEAGEPDVADLRIAVTPVAQTVRLRDRPIGLLTDRLSTRA